ncbi:MAG TPA: PIN domain-containing protein [archaeon]|nr:PIN domain-containing protein [archaeon]
MTRVLYVADTHAFLYYLLDRLPPTANKAFVEAEKGNATILVPTIALAEAIHVIEKERVNTDLKTLFSLFELGNNFTTIDLTLEITRMIPETRLPELHDRIITATAKLLNATLITKDKKIRESQLTPTTWD